MSNSLTHTIASSCVYTSPLAVTTIVGLHEFVKVSISASLKSFLLITCIDAPESTTNFRSSGLRVDAGTHLFSEGEKNVALSCSFNFKHSFGQLPRCFAGTLLLPLCLLLRPILKFWSVGATLMRFTWTNVTERRILVSNFSVTRNALCEFYTLDWLPLVCALPEKDSAASCLEIRNPIAVHQMIEVEMTFVPTSYHSSYQVSPVDRDIGQ